MNKEDMRIGDINYLSEIRNNKKTLWCLDGHLFLTCDKVDFYKKVIEDGVYI